MEEKTCKCSFADVTMRNKSHPNNAFVSCMLVERVQLSKGLCSVSAKHRGQQRDRVRERKRKTELGGIWAALCSAPWLSEND